MKNALIVSTLGLIMWLGETHVGKLHDKTMVESLQFTRSITLLADLGFKGWTPENVSLHLPHKKPRNSKTQKKELITKLNGSVSNSFSNSDSSLLISVFI